MSRTSSPPLGVEYVLLGFLAQRPYHGYELHKRLTELEGIGLIWNVKQANLYALLDKLEKQGFVSASLIPGEQHMPKKEFCLTDAGRRIFETWRSTPVKRARDVRQDFLARLYFARLHNCQTANGLLRNQGLICLGWLNSLEEQIAHLEPEQEFERMVCQFRIQQARAILEWLEWAGKTVESERMPA